jgi:photosystem II stability/assembly factor-like uncharacterized protein
MKKIFVLTIISLIYKTASAQWMQSLYDVSVSNFSMSHYFGENNLYIYGNLNNQLFLSDDNGQSFNNITHPLGSSRFRIITYNDSVNILTPQSAFFTDPAHFYVSRDKGGSWDKKYFQDSNGDTLTTISFIIFEHIWDNGKGVLVTRENNNFTKNFIYLTDNYGIDWDTSFECNFSFQNSLSDVNIFEDKLIFRSSQLEQKIFVLSDYGNITEERVLSSNNPSASLFGMAFKDSLNGLFLIDSDLYTTNDGGKTLNYSDNPEVKVSRLSYAKPSSDSAFGFYYGSGSSIGGFYSIDDSESWVQSETKGIAYQSFKNSKIGIASIRNSSSDPYEPYYFNGIILSVENILLKNSFIKTYPNPSNGSFTIELEESALIQIYSTTGTLVYNGNLEQGVQNISLPNLAKGLYILKAEGINFHQSFRVMIE